jgi:SPP1 gp7 family putative phage head morphogenesis protein
MATANQQAQDWINTQLSFILRLEKKEQREVVKVLQKMETDLAEIIRKIDVTGAVRMTTREKRQVALFKQSNEIINEYYNGITAQEKNELTKLALMESKVVQSELNKILGFEFAAKIDARTARIVATETLFGEQNKKANVGQWWSGQKSSFKVKYRDAMQSGILANDSISDMVRRLRGTRELGFTDGIMNSTYTQAKNLVRTSIQNVANEARMESYQENTDVIKGVQWSATLDNRTTPICQALDGLQWDMEFNPIGHSQEYPGATAHFGCRSTQIPVLKSFEEITGVKLKNKIEDTGTRASMTGQVPRSTTYAGWLRDQSKEIQNEILGITRAKMFRSGKFNLRDFVNDENRPLTIEQIEKKKGV